MAGYAPELLAAERECFPSVEEIVDALGAQVGVVPVPADCRDGILEAYYRRPEAYLDPAVRAAQSVWRRLPAGVETRTVGALAEDLASGAWDQRHATLRDRGHYDSALRLIVAGAGP